MNKLSHFSNRQIDELKTQFDSLLSDINQHVWKMNCSSREIEELAFLFVLDESKIDEIFQESNTPADYDKHCVVDTINDLRLIWDSFGLWFYNEELITVSKWKEIYNESAKKQKDWILFI